MMRARLEEFALTPRSASRLEPEKTRLIEFSRQAAARREKRGESGGGTDVVAVARRRNRVREIWLT